MLDQVIRSIAIAATVADALLLLRVLALRLHQVYVFVTLYCAVTLILDVGTWFAGWNTPADLRLLIYSRFVMTLVFPLAAWDVFQEISQQVAKFRRFHAMRMISGLVISGIFALVLADIVEDQEVDGISSATIQMALLMWAATSSAGILFLWNMRRYMRQQQIALEANTSVLWTFFIITLTEEILSCLLQLTGTWLSHNALSSIAIVLSAIDVAIVAWCAIRLRSIQTTAPAQQNAGA